MSSLVSPGWKPQPLPLSISVVNNTELIEIVAVTDNPGLSADICNTVARVTPEIISDKEGMKMGVLKVLTEGKEAAGPSSPDLYANMVIGGAAGLVISILLLLILHLRDNTVKGEEDVKALLPGVAVLGEIPSFDEKSSGQ